MNEEITKEEQLIAAQCVLQNLKNTLNLIVEISNGETPFVENSPERIASLMARVIKDRAIPDAQAVTRAIGATMGSFRGKVTLAKHLTDDEDKETGYSEWRAWRSDLESKLDKDMTILDGGWLQFGGGEAFFRRIAKGDPA